MPITPLRGSLFHADSQQNIGDVYPDQPNDNQLASIIAATGGSFPAPEEAPFGFNGRSYFLRLVSQF